MRTVRPNKTRPYKVFITGAELDAIIALCSDRLASGRPITVYDSDTIAQLRDDAQTIKDQHSLG